MCLFFTGFENTGALLLYVPSHFYIEFVRELCPRFESFYNFRIQNRFEMPPAETLIGRCRKGWNFVCTYRSNFHIFLSNFGKTNMTTSTTEQQYVDEAYRKTMDPVPTTRRVFLYDVSQLSDSNEQRANQFRTDLQHYLHLTNPIDPFIWFKPGRNHSTDHAKGKERGLFQTSTATTRPSSVGSSLRKIDICDERYNHLRSVLMHHAVQSSRWMRRYFVHANGVVVSSKDYFANSLLTSWEQDPCAARRLNSTA